MTLAYAWRLARRTVTEWLDDLGWIFAAAIATFATISLAPILFLAIRVARVLGEAQAFHSTLVAQLGLVVGVEGATSIDELVQASGEHAHGIWSTLLAIGIALFAGSRIFRALQRSIETMWGMPEPPRGGFLRTVLRFVTTGALTIVVVVALLALVVAQAIVAAIASELAFTNGAAAIAIRAGDVLAAALLLVPLIAALFRWLPRTRLRWRDVWLGAVVTTVATMLGQFAIAWYLAFEYEAAIYGSAASVLVIVVWLYYTAYIFLLGAEFTQVLSRARAATSTARRERDLREGREPEPASA